MISNIQLIINDDTDNINYNLVSSSHFNDLIVNINATLLKYSRKNFRNLIKDYPRCIKVLNLSKLHAHHWCSLLVKYPEYSNHCNWKILTGLNWSMLIINHPHLSVHCDWYKLNGLDWRYLLSVHPQFAKHCDLSKFSNYVFDYSKEK